MAINTLDSLLNALGNNSSRLVLDKASIANAAAGQFFSLWRATGQPAQGAIPTSFQLCDQTLTGAVGFTQQSSPSTSYLGWLSVTASNNAVGFGVHDRLAHMGGLSLNVTTAQTVTGFDLSLNLGSANLANRIGDANYSDVLWWLECYADGGATASNATINVTYNDGTTGNLNTIAVGGTLRAGRALPLNAVVPAAVPPRFIRAINSVTLSAATGAAGNFGFTATRMRTEVPCNLANLPTVFDWAQLGLPEVQNNACLSLITVASTTSTGTFRGGGKIPHG